MNFTTLDRFMTSISLVLRLNAASCLVFGALFALRPDTVARTLGAAPPIVIVGLGSALLVNGVHLALVSMRARPKHLEILWFALGDMAWWLASASLIASGIWITAVQGIALTIMTGLLVAGLGTAQLFLLGLEHSGLTASGQWRRIGRSWLSLPTWVKLWLFALNAVFLAAPAVMTWDSARVVLISYTASGPLLLGFAVHAGGLNRCMGVAHLVPWVPMLIWLLPSFHGFDTNSVESDYAALLGVMTVVCLAFDLYDLLRWLRGERSILLPSSSIGGSVATE